MTTNGLKHRVEKYRGMTLVVRDQWIDIVHDASGFTFSGPVKTDADVLRVAAEAIPFLQRLGAADNKTPEVTR